MNNMLVWGILGVLFTVGLVAENNSSVTVESKVETNSTLEGNLSMENNVTENNSSKTSSSTSKKEDEALQKQMDREKKYAREQVFYQGREYDLSSFEVDKSSLDNIPLIEPDYDFEMDDVYD